MPKMDGETFALEARKLAPDLKVVLVSGHAPQHVHAAIREHNDLQFLAKPFQLGELARVLRLS